MAGAFLLSQPLLQSWAAASTSILSPTKCLRRRVACTAEPDSPTRERPRYPQPWKLLLLPLGLVQARGKLDQLLFPLPSRSSNWGS